MKQDRGWDNFDNTGPYWNFSSLRVTEWFLNEVAAEIVREANVQVSRLFLTRSYTFHTLLISSYHFSILYIYTFLWHQNGIKVIDEVVQHFVATKKRGRLLWWNGLSLLWRDCWKLQCRCSYWRRSAALADDSNQMFQPFQTFSNIFIQPWFCPDVEYRAHHRRISETHTGFAPAFCDSKISKRRDIRLI